ncbi:CASP-like protein 1F2 [Cucumis sativus]|uniref:CASP-like protein n=1 Tax=Cucumis sativus TaxID=3659 RepID=A0A0A0LR45_CUCSA|nr:CASP-like protein 1F2 [Cucumis sativus]
MANGNGNGNGNDMDLEPKSGSDDHDHDHPTAITNLHLCYSQIILRVLAIASTLAATWIILTAKQSVLIFGIPFDARYNDSSAFQFFAFANAIASAFCFLSLCFLIFLSTRPSSNTSTPLNFYIFFFFRLHDLLMMGLVLSGCSAATAIGFVGKYGNTHTGWSPICNHFPSFCNRVTASIAISYFSVICLLILTTLSLHTHH